MYTHVYIRACISFTPSCAYSPLNAQGSIPVPIFHIACVPFSPSHMASLCAWAWIRAWDLDFSRLIACSRLQSNVDVSFASAASDGSSLVYNIEALASGTYQFCIRLMSSTNNFEAVSQGTLSALTPTVSQVFPLQLGVQAQTTVTIMGTRLSASATDLAVIASSSSCSSSSLTTLPSFAIGSFSSSSSSGSQLTVPVTGNTAGSC